MKQILCIGSALWDVIGHAEQTMTQGHDSPGNIRRQPGGVALNVANALARNGVSPTLLSAIGNDSGGEELIEITQANGINCDYVTRVDDPTDIYMAIEHSGTLFGAVADCASLEKAGEDVFAPLRDGRVASIDAPFDGIAVIDGNLPADVLHSVLQAGDFKAAQVYFVPASPGKAKRMVGILGSHQATLFVNKTEAEIICGEEFSDSHSAAISLTALGIGAVVTNSAEMACVMRDDNVYRVMPPDVTVRRVTGAGDAFLAGFVAAQVAGANDKTSLNAAAHTAAHHISEGRP